MNPESNTAGISAPLPWPPPGLEALRGRAGALARSLGIASLFILGALVEFAVVGSVGPQTSNGPGPLLLCGSLTIVATFLQLRAAYGVWTAMSAGGMSAWRGYTWLTIGEVMADRGGDTGALIAGSGEFGSLTPETRSTMRVIRVLTAFGRGAAGVLPMPAFLFAASLGANGLIGPGFTTMITLAPSIAILIAVWIAERMESIPLRQARDEIAKQFERRTSAIAIADQWYAAFDEARAGQGLGRGRAGGVLRAWVVGAVGGLTLLGMAALFFPFFVFAAGNASGMYRQFSTTGTATRLSDVAHMRQFGIPPDPSITPARAGDAFRSIDAVGETQRQPYEKPPAHAFPAWPMFGSHVFPGRQNSGWSGPRSPDVLDFAKKGLTPEQRTYLQDLSANPLWNDFDIVARAPRVDIAGGKLITPLPSSMTAFDLPIAHFVHTKEVAYANTARAALYLANGRRDEAERVLRETVSFGFHIADDGNSSVEVLMGAIVVGIGRDALERLFKLTGDGRDTVIAQKLRPTSVGPATGAVLSDAQQLRTRAGVVPYLASSRALSLDAMLQSNLMLCGSVSGLLFGPERYTRMTIESNRRRIARSPAEGEVFDLYANVLERRIQTDANERRGLFARVFQFSARLTGGILGNQRITNCAKLVNAGYR